MNISTRSWRRLRRVSEKDFSQFTHFVIPELDAVFTEEWDYTWILWHRGNGAVEALAPLVADAGLHHWNDP